MTNYLGTKIGSADAADLQAMINDLCTCVQLSKDQFVNHDLRFMLMAILKERPEFVSDKYVAFPSILSQKVGSLPNGSMVYKICAELAALNGLHIEAVDGKKVISLIKASANILCPKLPRTRKLTRNQLRHLGQTRLIIQRRQNGSL